MCILCTSQFQWSNKIVVEGGWRSESEGLLYGQVLNNVFHTVCVQVCSFQFLGMCSKIGIPLQHLVSCYYFCFSSSPVFVMLCAQPGQGTWHWSVCLCLCTNFLINSAVLLL